MWVGLLLLPLLEAAVELALLPTLLLDRSDARLLLGGLLLLLQHCAPARGNNNNAHTYQPQRPAANEGKASIACNNTNSSVNAMEAYTIQRELVVSLSCNQMCSLTATPCACALRLPLTP
jgi:hypothetical protein